MCTSNLCDPYVELATDVLKAQNLRLLKSLKDFLTGLPNSICEEDILTTAFRQLADIDPEAYCWLLQHACDHLSEMDLVSLAIELVESILQGKGFSSGVDFRIDPDGMVYLTPRAKSELLLGASAGDRLLIEKAIHFYV